MAFYAPKYSRKLLGFEAIPRKSLGTILFIHIQQVHSKAHGLPVFKFSCHPA